MGELCWVFKLYDLGIELRFYSEPAKRKRPTQCRSFSFGLRRQHAPLIAALREILLRTAKHSRSLRSLVVLRRGGDSNSRGGFPPDSFQDCSIQPLWHPSVQDTSK